MARPSPMDSSGPGSVAGSARGGASATRRAAGDEQHAASVAEHDHADTGSPALAVCAPGAAREPTGRSGRRAPRAGRSGRAVADPSVGAGSSASAVRDGRRDAPRSRARAVVRAPGRAPWARVRESAGDLAIGVGVLQHVLRQRPDRRPVARAAGRRRRRGRPRTSPGSRAARTRRVELAPAGSVEPSASETDREAGPGAARSGRPSVAHARVAANRETSACRAGGRAVGRAQAGPGGPPFRRACARRLR